MRKTPLFVVIAVTLISGACHRSVESKDHRTSHPLRTHKEAIDTLRLDQAAQTKPLETETLDSDQMQALLRNQNLSMLWQPEVESGEVAALYNGFYGTDHHRIEIYFGSVAKDPKKANVYHVIGKSRFKKHITPFSGEIVIDSVAAFHDPNLNQEQIKNLGFKEIYSAAGTFILQEDSSFTGSGVFKGNLTLDFGIQEDNTLALWYFSPTRGNGTGFLFDGKWTSYKTGKSKEVLWAKDIFMIADDVLEDFSIGERDVEINPKYRSLGWDNFWENDEWYNAPEVL